MHAHGLRGSLEHVRKVLGLPLPWIALCPQWTGAQRSRLEGVGGNLISGYLPDPHVCLREAFRAARCRVSILSRRRYGERDRAFESAAKSQRRTIRVKSVVW